MGIPPTEADRLDWGTYSGLIFQNNLANESPDQSVEPPSLDQYESSAARVQAKYGGRATH